MRQHQCEVPGDGPRDLDGDENSEGPEASVQMQQVWEIFPFFGGTSLSQQRRDERWQDSKVRSIVADGSMRGRGARPGASGTASTGR